MISYKDGTSKVLIWISKHSVSRDIAKHITVLSCFFFFFFKWWQCVSLFKPCSIIDYFNHWTACHNTENKMKCCVKKILRCKSQALRSQEMPWLKLHTWPDSICWRCPHCNKNHHICSVIESTNIPSLHPLAAASFQALHARPCGCGSGPAYQIHCVF